MEESETDHISEAASRISSYSLSEEAMNWKRIAFGVTLVVAQSATANEITSVHHGMLYTTVNDDRQLTLVLDTSASEQSPPDGIADAVLQFAPMKGEPLPESISNVQSLKGVTIERHRDGMTLVLENGARYHFLVPQKVGEVSEFRENRADNVIPGLALSWYDLSRQQLDIQQALEEFDDRPVIQ